MIHRLRRWANPLRGTLAGIAAAIGLIAAAGFAEGKFDPMGLRLSASVAGAEAMAAPAADVSRFRPAQATTSTATPLIRLTPATLTPVGGGGSGTATVVAGTPDPGEDGTGTPDSGGVGTGTPDVGGTPGGGSDPGEPGPGSGHGPGEPRQDPTTNALGTAGVMPAGTSLPGMPGSGPEVETGSTGLNPFATSGAADLDALSATVEDLRNAPFERSVGPFGAAVDVDDPAAATLWRERGSPRDDQPWAERFASNRPGPWGWLGFYPILILLFAVAAWRVVAGIRGQEGG